MSWIRNTAFKEPNNRFKESIPPAYIAWRAGYDNPIPIRFLAPIHCLQIPAQVTRGGFLENLLLFLGIDSSGGTGDELEFLESLWGLGTEEE